MIREEAHKYTIVTCSPPDPGYFAPMLRMARALAKKGHKVYYASSKYDIAKYKKNILEI